MTLSANDMWTAYREEGDQVNHDGSWKLPESVHELPDAQARKWQAVANLANQHASEAIEPVRARLWEENAKLRSYTAELERQLMPRATAG